MKLINSKQEVHSNKTSSATKYSPSSNDELKAIQVLESLFDVARVKSFINKHDKIPNHDGKIEITDEHDSYIGEFTVQVKKQNPRRKLKCAYEKGFINFCYITANPVLLFLIDLDQRIAYWRYLDNDTINDLLNKKTKTVTIHFTENQSVNNKKHLTEWIAILQTLLTRRINFEKFKEENRQIELDTVANKLIDPSYSKSNKIFAEVHKFLDIYNFLLDNDFEVVKRVFFPHSWKIGIVIDEYFEKRIRYFVYTIPYDKNDTQIKIVDAYNKEYLFNIAERMVGHYTDNPIRNKPIPYAHQNIYEDLKKILSKKGLLITNSFLAHERLIAFIDEYHDILNLKKNAREYLINDFIDAIEIYLPIWLETAGLLNNAAPPSIVNLNFITWRISNSDKKRITLLTTEKIETGYKVDYLFFLECDVFNLEHIEDCVLFLKSIYTDKIFRQYPLKHYPRKSTYLIEEQYSVEKIKSALTIFYKNLPQCFDDTIKSFFPKLSDKVKFFNGFNRVIVIVNFGINRNYDTPVYSLDTIYLENLTNNLESTIDVYCTNIDQAPIVNRDNFFSLWNKEIVIGQQAYKVIGMDTRMPLFIFEKLPMYGELYDVLERRFQEYFKNKIEQ